MGFMVVHYVVAAYGLFGHPSPSSEWDYLWQAPHGVHVWVGLGFLFYLIGQYFVWCTILKNRFPDSSNPPDV